MAIFIEEHLIYIIILGPGINIEAHTFIDFTPYRLIIKFWLYACVIQVIPIAYLFLYILICTSYPF